MRNLLLIICSLFILNTNAQWVTIADGSWSNPAIWNTGTVPQTFGAYTVEIDNDVTLDVNPDGAAWTLTVNSGASLTQSGCRTISSYNAGSHFINNGTITCYLIDGPGRVTNNGITNSTRLNLYGAGSLYNNVNGVFSTSKFAIFSTGILKNYGTINASGITTPCYVPASHFFEFSGDSLYNNGTINAADIGIYSIIHAMNDTDGTISTNDYFDLTNSVFDNYGNIEIDGDYRSGTTTFNNYDTINIGNNFNNFSNSFLNNYGCSCYPNYNGVINITGIIANNNGETDNNGIINVLGASATNSNRIGASSCGLLNLTAAGLLESYNGSEIFGNLVIVGSVNCFGCTQDATVHVSPTPTPVCDPIILPTEIVSFDANLENEVVKTTWTTATEINNDYYVVQRSKDAINFEQIGTVQGAGNSSIILNYTFYDEHPYKGISYYRLKQVDFNGDYSYTGIKSVYLAPISILNIYPNPAKNFVNIIIGTPSDMNITAEVFNNIGQRITKIEKIITTGRSNLTINTSNLSSGNYIFKITTPNDTTLEKEFIKK